MKTKLNKLIDKYISRKEDAETQIDEDRISLAEMDTENTKWLTEDIFSLETQVSIYECIIKDLKELENEISR
jgi:hypothetical protein